MSLDDNIDDIPGLEVAKDRFFCDTFLGPLEGLAEHFVKNLMKIFLGVEFEFLQLGPGPFVDH